MAKKAEAERLADGEKLELLTISGMMVLVICHDCHHQAELGLEYVRRRIGLQTTVGQLRPRLRCKQCGARRAVVLAYRLPR